MARLDAREQSQRSFGDWLRQRRRELDFTREELARQVGCAAITLRKLEAEERRPSKQIVERLADILGVPADQRPALLRFARGDPFAVRDDDMAPDRLELQPGLRHNLPEQLTSFIGREKEISEVKRLLLGPAGARLLTLTGTGGAGKTRLALQIAADEPDHFADGVWLIELAPLADSVRVPQAVATVLGLREVPRRPLTEVLIDHLRLKQVLLVLDNCEHLIQACAELVEALLRGSPHLTILATSREALGVSGESVYHVPSLSLPDPKQRKVPAALAESAAVRLFVDRAATAKPGFAMTSDNAAAVGQVCRQLDGLPLAIELAAARVGLLKVQQIADRMGDRFQLLTSGKRTALPRHQTLAALIDWSYDLLSEPERRVLRRLAVFMGGWTLPAAEAVCAGDGVDGSTVLDLLTQLVSKSLVVAQRPFGEEARYHMLETIRQYALAKLAASGEADAVRRGHAAYYLVLAEAGGPTGWEDAQPGWLDRMETEHDNLRAALMWSQSGVGGAELGLRLAVAIRHHWFGRGYWSEGRGWVEAALAQAEAERLQDRHLWAMALSTMGYLLVLQGDYAAAEGRMAHSLKLFQELGDHVASAWVTFWLGLQAREHGDAATARLRLEEGLALFRALRDQPGIAWALVTLGGVAVMQEDTAWATALLDEGLTLFRAQQIRQGIAWALNHLGHVAQIQGKYERAKRFHHESLPLFRESAAQNNGNLGIAWAFQGLGETALAQGDASLAATRVMEALALFRDLGHRAGMAWCLAGLAGVAVLDEEPERAARLWGAAEALRQSTGARQAPAARVTRERLMAAAREQLGEAAFAAAWAEGQAMTTEKAIEQALGAE